jgi:hypothetical protein
MSRMKVEFSKSFASHPKAKFWSDRNEKRPDEVNKNTKNKYWFNCDVCNHELYKSLDNITSNNSWCPYCTNYTICSEDICNYCFNKSFITHEKSKYWSKKNSFLPRHVMKMSDKKAWFDCNICGHSFETVIKSVSKNSWCPYCCKSSHTLCSDFKCILCYEKSFASNWRSWWWSNENKEKPLDVAKSSNNKYKFNCDVCNHTFNAKLSHISSGKWCPYCCKSSNKLCDNINCLHCFNKSFASHEKSKYWSKKNNITPREITIGSSKKFLFQCNICDYEFEKHLKSISTHNSWCPKCINKTEKKLHNWLLSKYSNVRYMVKYDWCVNPDSGYKLCYDFIVNDNIIIELDGKQHFEQVGKWRSPEEENKRDRYKIKSALENSFSIIHIYQVDVFKDINNWDIKLENSINKIIEMKIPQFITINIDINHFIS